MLIIAKVLGLRGIILPSIVFILGESSVNVSVSLEPVLTVLLTDRSIKRQLHLSPIVTRAEIFQWSTLCVSSEHFVPFVCSLVFAVVFLRLYYMLYPYLDNFSFKALKTDL